MTTQLTVYLHTKSDNEHKLIQRSMYTMVSVLRSGFLTWIYQVLMPSTIGSKTVTKRDAWEYRHESDFSVVFGTFLHLVNHQITFNAYGKLHKYSSFSQITKWEARHNADSWALVMILMCAYLKPTCHGLCGRSFFKMGIFHGSVFSHVILIFRNLEKDSISDKTFEIFSHIKMRPRR